MLRFATTAVPIVEAGRAARFGATIMGDESLQLGAPLQLWYDLVRHSEERVRTPLPELVESYFTQAIGCRLR